MSAAIHHSNHNNRRENMATEIKERILVDHPKLTDLVNQVMLRRIGKREIESAEKVLMDEVHAILDDLDGDRWQVGDVNITRIISERASMGKFKELLLKRGVDYTLVEECEQESKSTSVSVRMEKAK
jgi:hypothetical protein